VEEHSWNGAIFAAAGLERIHLRPGNAVDLDWMLPAPAQGAIMIVCRENDDWAFQSCMPFNDEVTALCTKIERDFLRGLMGGCSTPVSALAQLQEDRILFKGNVTSQDGRQKAEVEKSLPRSAAGALGLEAAKEILANGVQPIMEEIRKKGISFHDLP
jgi:hydroxymethylbilane synthase